MSLPTSLRYLFVLVLVSLAASYSLAQASYTSQIRGIVTDQSGASIANATVTITNDATGIASTAKTNNHGEFLLTGLRPDQYTVKAQAPGFQGNENKGVVLAVSQQTTLNFTLKPASVVESITVTQAPPLLDTESAAIGTDVTNQYVRDIPLYGRSMFGLVFLAGGVTETTGAGINDNYPTGTNFVSNGQRNATAEITLDGSPISAPEQGEGGNSNVYYQPSVEIVQEFKVQNNSFSAEFGNNGGTVVNMVLKQGGNNFHGSGWWYGQRSNFDARDFFNPAPNPKPDHVRDQYGFSLGGPIKRNKTFFFLDFEKVRQQDPINLEGIVPTALERTGDFSKSLANLPDPTNSSTATAGIYDPCAGNQLSPTPCPHNQFSYNGNLNVIPPSEIDPIGQAILNLYPMPNIPGAVFPNPNWRQVIVTSDPGWQFDIKLDHQISANQKISGRYSRHHDVFTAPTVIGNSDQGDGFIGTTVPQNGGVEYDWAVKPNLLWTSRFSVDRVNAPVQANKYPSLSDVGLSPQLAANGLTRIPAITVDDPFLSTYTQCCVDTHFAHTLASYSSALQWVKGSHSIKFGGEQRVFYNNFWQPDNPTGIFNFSRDVTTSQPNNGLGSNNEGNPFATILVGYPHDAQLHLVPAVADKSKETAFYVQDDWKATPKLTLNLGLRYEWSTPYTERQNRLQFNDFTGDTGINIPVSRNLDDPSDPNNPQIDFGQIGEIRGTSIFATSGHRNAPVDRNNFAPRLGFAYQLAPNTVLRGGAGMFYGMNVATNFQYAGPGYAKTADMFFTKDNFAHQFACLGPSPTQPDCVNSSPFPGGLALPPGRKYGALAQWGFSNASDLDVGTVRNAEIYQWNLGIQHLFPWKIVVAIDYSANRSTHLPWGGSGGISTRDRNFLSSSVRNALVAALNPTHDPTSTAVSDYLNTEVPNPFQCFFTTGAAMTGSWCPATPIFTAADVSDSRYIDPTIPQQLLLEPYPQFDGAFEGLPKLAANSWYHSVQIRFQKRASHYISFEGNYTFSKATDDSSAGRNAWVGNLGLDNPQVLDNLKAEHSIAANDAPHRLTTAIIFDLPVGKDRLIGSAMNPVMEALVGGWSLSTFITVQSGQPLALFDNAAQLTDGNQRPNVICSQLTTGLSYRAAAETGGSVLNQSCFADPGDNIPGNAPRYFSNLRGDGIRNVDASLSKEFTIREGKTLQVRAEMFNAFNHQRFAFPDVGSGDGAFGTVTSTTNNFRRMQFGARFQF
jgi:hypothetical protein